MKELKENRWLRKPDEALPFHRNMLRILLRPSDDVDAQDFWKIQNKVFCDDLFLIWIKDQVNFYDKDTLWQKKSIDDVIWLAPFLKRIVIIRNDTFIS